MKFLSLGFKSTPLKIHPTTLSNVLIFDDDFSVFSKQLIQNLTNFPELNMLVFSQQFSEKDILLFDKSIPNKQFCFSGFQFNFDNNEFPYFFNPFISPSGVNQTIWNNILASLFSHTFNSNNSILFPLVEILNSSVFNNDSSFAELQSSITNFIDLSYSPDRNYEKFSLLLQHLSLWFQEFHPAFHSFTEQKALSIQSLYKQEQFILFQHVEFFDGYYKRFSTILSILHLILFHIFNNKKIKNPTFIVLDDFDVSFFSDVISNKYKLSHFLKLANQFNFFFIFCVNDKKVFSDFSGEFSTSVELIHQNNLHHYYLLNSSNNQLSHILTLIPDSERFLNGKFSNFEFKFN